jgi:hypothetical protein
MLNTQANVKKKDKKEKEQKYLRISFAITGGDKLLAKENVKIAQIMQNNRFAQLQSTRFTNNLF